MFTALRAGWISLALRQQGRILSIPDLQADEKEQTLLLGGSIYLESGDYKKVRDYYTQLKQDANDQQVRQKSNNLLIDLQTYEEQPRKSLWLAGITIWASAGQWSSL